MILAEVPATRVMYIENNSKILPKKLTDHLLLAIRVYTLTAATILVVGAGIENEVRIIPLQSLSALVTNRLLVPESLPDGIPCVFPMALLVSNQRSQ